jgi:hypothetical protein
VFLDPLRPGDNRSDIDPEVGICSFGRKQRRSRGVPLRLKFASQVDLVTADFPLFDRGIKRLYALNEKEKTSSGKEVKKWERPKNQAEKGI